MHQWQIRLARFRVVKDRVPRAECAARTVLTRQSDWNSIQQQRAEGERFGVVPFVGTAVFEYLALMFEDDALDLRLDLEPLRDSSETIDDGL